MNTKYIQVPTRDTTHLFVSDQSILAEDDECDQQQVRVTESTHTMYRVPWSRQDTVNEGSEEAEDDDWCLLGPYLRQ